MPGVCYLLALLVGSLEAQLWWRIHTRVVHRQCDLHLEVVGEERLVGYSRLVQPFYTGHPAEAVYMVVDMIAHRQPATVSLSDMPLEVRAPLKALLQLLPLVQQTPVTSAELTAYEFFTSHFSLFTSHFSSRERVRYQENGVAILHIVVGQLLVGFSYAWSHDA